MNMRCSLLGHSEGEEEVETIREETDAGVIEIEQTYRECTNCGHKRVITENKSVRGDDVSGDESDDPEQHSPSFTAPNPDAPLASDVEPSVDGEYRDAIIMDDSSSETVPESAETTSDGRSIDDTSDSAVVISNSHDDSVTDEGDSSTDGGDEVSEEPLSPVPGVTPEDATVLSHSSGAIAWKEADSPEEPAEEAEPTGPRRRIQKGGKSVQCPSCGYVENQHVANLVAGDACPECRRAYLNWYEPVESKSEDDVPSLPQQKPHETDELSHNEPSDSAMFID